MRWKSIGSLKCTTSGFSSLNTKQAFFYFLYKFLRSVNNYCLTSIVIDSACLLPLENKNIYWYLWVIVNCKLLKFYGWFLIERIENQYFFIYFGILGHKTKGK